MKFKKLLVLFGIASAGMLFSCETTDCAECDIVKEDSNGKVIDRTPQGKYCDDELNKVEGSEPFEWEGETTYYECNSSTW